MLKTYSEIKNKLANILIETDKISVSKFSKELLPLIGNKLEANIFTLVVVGQFKRGKTTFINTLLGADVLPTAIIPLTSIITILKYGNKVEAIVFMNDGSKKKIPIKEIQHYATEKYNPKNEKGVDRVEVFYPSSYLKSGVQIVDTPGVASVHEHNTEITYQYLPQADAAIFLVSVDPPLTQAELLFLQDLKKLVSRVFFIQNKIDIVSDTDRQEALDFTKSIIEKRADFKNITIYPLSAKEALEAKVENDRGRLAKSGLLDFEKSLEQFLLEDKGNVLLHSSADKIRSVINEELFLAELEEKSLHTPLKELESKLADFRLFLSEINQEGRDSGRLFAEEIKELQKEGLEEDLEKLKKEKTKELIAKVDDLATVHKKTSNKKFIELLNEFLANEIRNIFTDWRGEEESKLKQQLEKILGRFIDRINKLFKKIFVSSSELFGVSQREVTIRETLPAEIEFRFQTEDESSMLSMTLDALKIILPEIITHRMVWGESRERAKMLVDRHSGKLRYDFSQRMEKLIRDYKTIFGSAVMEMQKDMLQALETGLAIQQKTETETKKQEIELGSRIAKLNKLKTEIRNL